MGSKGKIMNQIPQGLHYRPFVFPEFSDAAPPPAAQAGAEPEADLPPAEPEAPPAPSFGEEELLAARREAEELGRQKGYEDAKREWDEKAIARETQIMALLEGLAARLDGELAEQERHRNALRGDMAGIVLMIARKLVAGALDTQPLGAVEPMVDDCLALLAGEGRLGITVHDTLVEPLTAYLAAQPREGQVIEVLADPRMQPGDCRIQWPGGKAERSQEALWSEMEKIVSRALSKAKNSD